MTSLASLFSEEPQQWGFRGDPHLWRDMQRQFENVPIPDSSAKLEATIHSMFHRLTGCTMETNETIVLEKYNFGGMSGGGISTEFWRDSALPLLVARFTELNSS